MAEDMFLPHDRGGFLRKVADFPSGYSNDGIFGFIIDGIKYIRQKKGGVINSVEVGIYPNGSDMTAKINAAFAHAWVKTIDFANDDGDADITITGDVVVPAGKTMRFAPGTKLVTTGAGTVRGGIIDADDYSHIFGGTQDIVPEGFSRGYASVMWWGAIPDDADSAAEIQKAADTIIYNNHLPLRLEFPKGKQFGFEDYVTNYMVNDPIILAKKVGGSYQPFTIHLTGNGGMSINDKQQVKIHYNGTTGFCIGVQLGYGFKMKGIGLSSVFNPTALNTPNGFYNTRPENYSATAALACRDSRFSPHALLVIDPFSRTGAVPADGGYPGLSAWYTYDATGGQGGSTGCIVEDCGFASAVVGIILSPNGHTANVEGCVFNKVNIARTTIAFSSCQGQTKGNIVTNFNVLNTNTIFDNFTYGGKQGYPFIVDGGYVAGFNYRIFNIICFQEGMSISNVFTELTYKFGRIIGSAGYGGVRTPSSIENCNFKFIGNAYAAENVPLPEFFAEFTDVRMRGGVIAAAGNVPITFNGLGIINDGVSSENPLFIHNDVEAGSGALPVYSETLPGNTEDVGFAGIRSRQIRRGLHTISDVNGYNKTATLLYNLHFNWAFKPLTLTAWSWNTTTKTGILTVTVGKTWLRVGDVILFQYNSAALVLDDNRTMAFGSVVAGIVSAISGVDNTVTLSNVPNSVGSNQTGVVTITAASPLMYGIPFIADTANGSTTLTNVEGIKGLFPSVGDFVHNRLFEGNFYEQYARITAVDAVLKTVTISQVWNFPWVGYNFINGYPDIQMAFPGTELLFVGTKVQAQYSTDFYKFVTQSGFVTPSGTQIHQAVIQSFTTSLQLAAAAEVPDTPIVTGADTTATVEPGKMVTLIMYEANGEITIYISRVPTPTADQIIGEMVVGTDDIDKKRPYRIDIPADSSESAQTIYFTGITGEGASVTLTLYKKTI